MPVPAPRRNMMSPARIATGATAVTSKDSTWTMRVVPILAPNITASAGTSATSPAAVKPETMSAVAVLLWSRVVTAAPATKPCSGWRRARPSTTFSRGPSARITPVCTMWMPHRSRAAKPARSSSVTEKLMEEPMGRPPLATSVAIFVRFASKQAGEGPRVGTNHIALQHNW